VCVICIVISKGTPGKAWCKVGAIILKWNFKKSNRGMDWIDLAQDRNA
jgi:hypothetical protein